MFSLVLTTNYTRPLKQSFECKGKFVNLIASFWKSKKPKYLLKCNLLLLVRNLIRSPSFLHIGQMQIFFHKPWIKYIFLNFLFVFWISCSSVEIWLFGTAVHVHFGITPPRVLSFSIHPFNQIMLYRTTDNQISPVYQVL